MTSGLKGRGERVVDGVWRLRLPLPLAGIPHGNAWALETDDGIVLVDCGMHAPGSLDELERALSALEAGLEDVELLVCTHAHPDHYGLAADVVERAGCELWMHPRHAHTTAALLDPIAAGRLRRSAARRAGVPEDRLPEGLARGSAGIRAVVAPDHALISGAEIASASGPWRVVETPGHAPSHVCLFNADQRLLISADHLLERVGLHFDFGFTPDPVGEFFDSLAAVDALDVELCLPGHGAAFGSIRNSIQATEAVVHRRLDEVEGMLADRGAASAFSVALLRHGDRIFGVDGSLHLAETLALLTHLEASGRVSKHRDAAVDMWALRRSTD